MKKYVSIVAFSWLACTAAFAQSEGGYWNPQDPTTKIEQKYVGFDCVNLLDSTSVTVQPTGSGSFRVYRKFKVQTPRGAVNNRM